MTIERPVFYADSESVFMTAWKFYNCYDKKPEKCLIVIVRFL